MRLSSYKLSLILLFLLFLILYFPVIGEPYAFEELRLTSFFHTAPNVEINPFATEFQKGSRLTQLWKEYFAIYPPGLLIFYRVWSVISFDNELFMRLPLLCLILYVLYSLFSFIRRFTDKDEAALITLLIGLGPIWYGPLSKISPESFNLCFSFLSLMFFSDCIMAKSFRLKKIWIINIIGLICSYHFTYIIFSQIIASQLCRTYNSQKLFMSIFSVLSILSLMTLIIFNKSIDNNVLIFFWPKVKGDEAIRLMKFILLGAQS